jgi:hypothetical protein
VAHAAPIVASQKLFKEMYQAYKNGKLPNDPSASWYDGELGFFDFYIIPLAKKAGQSLP